MSRDWMPNVNGMSITRHRSEIMTPRDHLTPKVTGSRVKTFDELFLEQFVPLDSRKKVGNYVLGKGIGEGSFCKVRLGKNIDTGDKVAVTLLMLLFKLH